MLYFTKADDEELIYILGLGNMISLPHVKINFVNIFQTYDIFHTEATWSF